MSRLFKEGKRDDAQKIIEEGKKLGEEIAIDLPKGAPSKVISMGKQLLIKYGEELLPRVGKMHLNTTAAIRQ